jgi:hypothetical protein
MFNTNFLETRTREVRRIYQAVEKLPWHPLSPEIGYQNTPVLERFEPDFWALSARHRLFQQAATFHALG